MSRDKPFVAVVDDDESVRRAIKRLLSSVGLTAETFATGDEFLARFESDPSRKPACVVLDVQMPGASGLEVQARLAGSGIAVVFITAHDEQSVHRQAMAGGAAAYLRKPFDDEVLIKAVRAVLRPDAAP